jgi:hypothetical protein
MEPHQTSLHRLEEARWDQFVEHYSSCEACVLRLDDMDLDDLCPPGRSLFGMWLVSRARLLEVQSPEKRPAAANPSRRGFLMGKRSLSRSSAQRTNSRPRKVPT